MYITTGYESFGFVASYFNWVSFYIFLKGKQLGHIKMTIFKKIFYVSGNLLLETHFYLLEKALTLIAK